jgi:hypothetical protein
LLCAFLFTASRRRDAIVAKVMDVRTKGLTTVWPVAYPRWAARLFATQCLFTVIAITACGRASLAQELDRAQRRPAVGGASATATISWTDVPLIDALSRLERVFGDAVFLDRRIDPNLRVTLNMSATSLEQVVTAIAIEPKLGVSRMGGIVYVGPMDPASRLGTLARTRTVEANRLPESMRAALLRKRSLSWPKLAEPRELVTSLVERIGWRVESADRIPHDLWRAGALSELSAVEQLTVLLIGFELTFELRPENRVIAIVPLEASLSSASHRDLKNVPAPSEPAAKKLANTKQVYSLRVKEKPVGPVLQELARRLNWQLDIDEAAIVAAGLSLDARVSMAVENADQDQLLEALLAPAGLAYERENDRVRILPGEQPVD